MNYDLFTAEEAARQVGLKEATIRKWKSQGMLSPAGKKGRFHLYRLADVLAAEANRERKYRNKT